MPITITGGANCAQLQPGRVVVHTGTASVTITPTTGGVYTNCTLTVTDHAGLVSSGVAMTKLVVSNDPAAICLHPDTTVPAEECQALYQVYAHTAGTGRSNKTNWLSHPDIDSRFGVTTAVISGQQHITAISLPNNALQSTVPTEIENLSYLQSLDISNNSIQTIEN